MKSYQCHKKLSNSARDTRWVLWVYLHNVRITRLQRSPKGKIDATLIALDPICIHPKLYVIAE